MASLRSSEQKYLSFLNILHVFSFEVNIPLSLQGEQGPPIQKATKNKAVRLPRVWLVAPFSHQTLLT